jgi:hypothetical protein
MVLVRDWRRFFLTRQKTLGTLGKRSSQLVTRIPQPVFHRSDPHGAKALAIAAQAERDATEKMVGGGVGAKRRYRAMRACAIRPGGFAAA